MTIAEEVEMASASPGSDTMRSSSFDDTSSEESVASTGGGCCRPSRRGGPLSSPIMSRVVPMSAGRDVADGRLVADMGRVVRRIADMNNACLIPCRLSELEPVNSLSIDESSSFNDLPTKRMSSTLSTQSLMSLRDSPTLRRRRNQRNGALPRPGATVASSGVSSASSNGDTERPDVAYAALNQCGRMLLDEFESDADDERDHDVVKRLRFHLDGLSRVLEEISVSADVVTQAYLQKFDSQ